MPKTGPKNKVKTKQMLVNYLNRLPLKDLIHTGKQVKFFEVQEEDISLISSQLAFKDQQNYIFIEIKTYDVFLKN